MHGNRSRNPGATREPRSSRAAVAVLEQRGDTPHVQPPLPPSPVVAGGAPGLQDRQDLLQLLRIKMQLLRQGGNVSHSAQTLRLFAQAAQVLRRSVRHSQSSHADANYANESSHKLLHHSPCSLFNIVARLSAFNWQNVKGSHVLSSAAADEALVILVQPALTASFAALYLAETAHSAIGPSNRKSLDLQVPPLHLEQRVRPTAD